MQSHSIKLAAVLDELRSQNLEPAIYVEIKIIIMKMIKMMIIINHIIIIITIIMIIIPAIIALKRTFIFDKLSQIIPKYCFTLIGPV